MRASLSKLLHWEMFGFVCLAIALFFPYDTEHSSVFQVLKYEDARSVENLVELEERLYEDIMKSVKNGHHEKAYGLSKDYLRRYTAGAHYYEVYRVFRSLRAPASE